MSEPRMYHDDGAEGAYRHGVADGLALGMTQLDRAPLVRAVHAWFCGSSVNHGDERRPHIGWACERGADAIAAEYDRVSRGAAGCHEREVGMSEDPEPSDDDHDHHFDKRCETCRYLAAAAPSIESALDTADARRRATLHRQYLAAKKYEDRERIWRAILDNDRHVTDAAACAMCGRYPRDSILR